ncbi:MAG TPA: thioesterase family protein [Staphylococcus sp.]|nr:thioesterase family protein [Staphylococcus sp.]
MGEFHPFDIATQLTKTSDFYHGHTSEAYANMIGPFGGIVASTLLRAILEHPERLGEPGALTINYAAPVANGGFDIKATPTRTNRSTQHWYIELSQNKKTVITGTAVTAERRETWSSTDISFPNVPSVNELKRASISAAPPWLNNYDIRIIKGAPLALLQSNLNNNQNSTTLQWIQDYPKRKIDFLSLTAMCDAFFPRIWVRRKEMVPIGTVSLTIYFHADSETLKAHGSREVLGHTRAIKFYDGFFDQTGELWSPDGELLATTSQFVYYKS